MSILSRIPTVDPTAAHERDDDVVLLDVREPAEWGSGHAPGAVHIPLRQLSVDALPGAGAGPVYVICRSGARSGSATKSLRAAGVDAANVAGGMLAWQRADLPVV